MKILLFSEYSGFYNALKEGLQELGHDVMLIGRTDGYKKYPVDLLIDVSFFNKRWPSFFRKAIYKVSGCDIGSLEVFYKFLKHKHKFKNFDVVQLVNEFPLKIHPILEKYCLNYIFKHNQNVYLSACGDDTIYINYLLSNKLPYHFLTPYLKDKSLKNNYKYALLYTKKNQIRLHEFVINNIKAIIPADIDYAMAYINHSKATALIPFPIRLHYLDYCFPSTTKKIVIFHGVSTVNYLKKGSDYFDKAIAIIVQKHPEKVIIKRIESLPYATYVNAYNECHILLDQVFSYDQGYNALEAMAKGKVVFTGVEQEWLTHYKLVKNTVAINAKPNVNYLVDQLEWLILNPIKLLEISKNARQFVENEHHYVEIARKYVAFWKSTTN